MGTFVLLVAVSEEDSLMYYTDNTDWYTYNNNSFVPVFVDDIDNWVWSSEQLKTDAYSVCSNDTSCLYDVFITGKLEIGESTKSTAEESIAQNKALSTQHILCFTCIRCTYSTYVGSLTHLY